MNPSDLRFAKTHEWIAADGTVGLSDHAQHEITDVVFVELPKAGRSVKAGEGASVVESVKAAFDVYAPVAGQVAAVNPEVVANPALVNQSPYDKGWLFRLKPADPAEWDGLMTYERYQEFVKTAEPH
jgi:glycine cleavage system H protein